LGGAAEGYGTNMVVLVLLVLLALAVGIGGLVKGVLWLALIGLVLLLIGGFTGYRTLGSRRM